MKDPFMSRLTDLNIFGAGGLEAHLIKIWIPQIGCLDPKVGSNISNSWIQNLDPKC